MSIVHPFEESGLGKAPFRCIGMSEKVYVAYPGAPAQASGTCDHCGNGIRYCYHVQSADRREFVVGCDCVLKLNRADNRLVSEVDKLRKQFEAKQRAEKRGARVAREDVRIAAAYALLDNPAVVASLASQKHPCGFEGKSLLDYVDYCRRCAGQSGRLRVAKIIESALACEVTS